MAIARKPKNTTAETASTLSEKTIEALISKGGSSTKANKSALSDDDVKPVLLKMFNSQITDIESILEQLPKRHKVSRHAYIIQAVDEKIQRDKGKRK